MCKENDHIKNHFIFAQDSSCPFLVDPSQQATEWLKKHLKEQRLEVINQQVTVFYFFVRGLFYSNMRLTILAKP